MPSSWSAVHTPMCAWPRAPPPLRTRPTPRPAASRASRPRSIAEPARTWCTSSTPKRVRIAWPFEGRVQCSGWRSASHSGMPAGVASRMVRIVAASSSSGCGEQITTTWSAWWSVRSTQFGASPRRRPGPVSRITWSDSVSAWWSSSPRRTSPKSPWGMSAMPAWRSVRSTAAWSRCVVGPHAASAATIAVTISDRSASEMSTVTASANGRSVRASRGLVARTIENAADEPHRQRRVIVGQCGEIVGRQPGQRRVPQRHDRRAADALLEQAELTDDSAPTDLDRSHRPVPRRRVTDVGEAEATADHEVGGVGGVTALEERLSGGDRRPCHAVGDGRDCRCRRGLAARRTGALRHASGRCAHARPA